MEMSSFSKIILDEELIHRLCTYLRNTIIVDKNRCVRQNQQMRLGGISVIHNLLIR